MEREVVEIKKDSSNFAGREREWFAEGLLVHTYICIQVAGIKKECKIYRYGVSRGPVEPLCREDAPTDAF